MPSATARHSWCASYALLGAQRFDRVNASRTAGRQPGSEQRDSHEKQRGAEKDERIVEVHTGTAGSEKSCNADCSAKADHRTDERKLNARSENQVCDVANACAESEANGKLASALRHRPCDDAVNT